MLYLKVLELPPDELDVFGKCEQNLKQLTMLNVKNHATKKLLAMFWAQDIVKPFV